MLVCLKVLMDAVFLYNDQPRYYHWESLILLERGYSEDLEVYLVCLSRKKSPLFITKIFTLEISFYERFYILKKFYSAEKMNLLFFFLK